MQILNDSICEIENLIPVYLREILEKLLPITHKSRLTVLKTNPWSTDKTYNVKSTQNKYSSLDLQVTKVTVLN